MIEALKSFSIDKSDWMPVKFGDVVYEPKESVKDPVAAGIQHVVGLEHIDSEDIHLRRSASIEDGTTFKKKFDIGDVLFGRRRAYLKKAAKANFSGICSGDIIVMRAKENLLTDLLPFIINNDRFFDFAVKHSAGGLSPRVKFKSLAEYELLLPPKEIQVELAELLHRALKAITASEKLRDSFDVYRTVYLNKHFLGDDFRSHRSEWKTLGDNCDKITYGFTNPMPTVSEGPYMVTATNIRLGKIDFENTRKTSNQAYTDLITEKSRPVVGDILLTKDGRLAELAMVGVENICINQSVALIRPGTPILSEYLYHLLQVPYFKRLMIREAGGTAIKHIYITKLAKMKVPIPSLKRQTQLAQLALRTSIQRNKTDKQIGNLRKLLSTLIQQAF